MRNRRLPPGAGVRHRHHAGPALGRLSPSGRALWLSFVLVDADPFPSGRGAWRLRHVLDDRTRTDGRRKEAHRIHHAHRRDRHRAQAFRGADPFHGQPRCADRASQPRAAGGSSIAVDPLRPALRPVDNDPVHRSGQLQAGQRHARSQRRRRAAEDRRQPDGPVRHAVGHRRAARRRRIRRRVVRPADEPRSRLRDGAQDPGCDRGSNSIGRAPAEDHRQHRRGKLPEGRNQPGRAAGQCRCGHVQREGVRPRQFPVLCSRVQHQGA